MTYPASIEEAFLVHAPQSGDGCWNWRGNLRSGYGRLIFRHRHFYAHRFSYERAHGPIPDGMTVDHLCHNADPDCSGGTGCLHRSCVRPSHLGLASPLVNALRAGRLLRTGRCGKGHPVTSGNVYVVNGKRFCRACHLERQRQYQARAEHKAAMRAKEET